MTAILTDRESWFHVIEIQRSPGPRSLAAVHDHIPGDVLARQGYPRVRDGRLERGEQRRGEKRDADYLLDAAHGQRAS